MRFLADMGVAMRIVEWLRAQGHDESICAKKGYSGRRTPIFCQGGH
jgi:hypothetical protein